MAMGDAQEPYGASIRASAASVTGASGPVLPRGDVVLLLGGHRVERDAEGGELEAGDLRVDRSGTT